MLNFWWQEMDVDLPERMRGTAGPGDVHAHQTGCHTMPFEITLSASDKRAYVRWWGAAQRTSIREVVECLLDEPRFGPGFVVLYDHHDATGSLTADMIHNAMALFPRESADCTWVFIVSNEIQAEQLRCDLKKLSLPVDAHVFTDAHAAVTWTQSHATQSR
jgi:hypothetical protein